MKQNNPICQVVGCITYAVDYVAIKENSLLFRVYVCQKHLSQFKKVKK